MPRDFKLPDIGEGLTEAEIVRWLVAEGETVESDQPLVEVETDKAVVEIPSPYAGVVLKHGGAEGDIIEVGEVLVVIGEAGETTEVESEDRSVAPPKPEPEAQAAAEPSPIVGTLSDQAETIEASPSQTEAHALEVKALPIVRKLARENDIDLTQVTGTGPHGRITREDVEFAIAQRQREVDEEPPTAQVTEQRPSAATTGEDQRQTMSRLRRTIAANMSKSWSEIPHVTTFDDVDATRLLEVRDALGDRHGQKIPIEALVIRAVVPALEAFPEFNATLDGDDLIKHRSVNIGIAIDSPDGLLVGVIKDAGAMGVLDLSEEVRRLGERGKDRSLAPDELGGQTFTVSNIGAVGGGHGTPIVPYGTTAILSVGRARERPIVFEGELVIAPVMPLSLSYDHRVVDGAQGRRFMSMVIENLEEPALFLA